MIFSSVWHPDIPEGWRAEDPGYPRAVRVWYQRATHNLPCNSVLTRFRELWASYPPERALDMIEHEMAPANAWQLGATPQEHEHARKVIDKLRVWV